MNSHLLGTVERVARALEEHVRLLREGLELLREITSEPKADRPT